MTPEHIRQKWSTGEAAYGYWVAIPDTFALELALTTKFDYVCLDQQHGMIDYSDLAPMFAIIEASGAVPIVRVPSRDPAAIGRVLDAGAMGLVVPMVETEEQVEEVLAASRYSPEGTRSFGPIRASISRGMSSPTDLQDILTVVMVETPKGIDNIDSIVSTEGIDAVYIGPADLALSLGLPPSLESDSQDHADAIRAIRTACRSANIGAGIQCSDGNVAFQRIEEGFNMVTVAKDSSLVMAAARKELLTAKNMDPATYVQQYA